MARLLTLLFLLTAFGAYSYSNNSYNPGSKRSFEQFTILESALEEDQLDDVEPEIVSEEEQAMDAIKQSVLEQKRFVDRLDSATFISLPVGLSYNTDTLADPNYFIIIDEATIYPQYAEFSAFMSLVNPIDGQVIRFRANHIKFSFKSGLINGFNLELVSEIKTKLSSESSLYWMPGSFVDWDCNGFKSLGINAKVELDKNKYVKVNPYTRKELGQVSSTCFITATGLSDILMELTFDPFKIKGFEEAYFSFKKLTLDFSDSYNAPGFVLPANYPGGYSGDKANLWKGFYVQEAQVFLSEKFNAKDSTITFFFAKDILLDDFGLTGKMGAENLLSYDKGKLGNWKMAVSHLEISFFTGDFVSLGLNGGVLVKGIEEPMVYEAFYDAEGNYHFGINPGAELSFNAFAAKVNLKSTSRIDVWVEEGKFMPAAILDGDISFAGSKKPGEGSSIIHIPYIDFQGLRIATKAPVFDIDYLALTSKKGKSDFNLFPITINGVAFDKRNGNQAEISFDLYVNLIPGGELGISAETNIGVLASVNESDWKYNGLNISAISISASVEGSFDITGSVAFIEDDPVYGKGFRGDVDATFGGTFNMKAIAVFGKVDGFRYFFVDAFVQSQTGLSPPPIILTGFGGGLFYKMKQAAEGGGSDFGKSTSGVNYIPDKNTFLGIKAGLTGAFINKNLVQCEASFSIDFTSSFGLSRISFLGEANVINIEVEVSADKIKEITKNVVKNKSIKLKVPSPMMVSVSMLMDFQNKSFHTEMNIFMNVAGVLKGTGEDNRAGWGVMHIDPDKWYLHMGTPTDPIGLNFIGLMEVNSYFMAGHDIPDAMMMNQRVLEILDMDQSDFNGERKEGDLMTGKGLAFGAHLKLDTGDLTFLIFYAQFELGGGFDIMLLDYGPNAFCKGRSGTPGINGWFAKGQAYAYFAGKIGIKVKIFGKKKKFDIINLQAAVAIRIEGPNPTWMKGVVGGKYRLLGGAIKGKCKFEMTVGEKCELRTLNDLSDLEIIADLTPAKDAEEVDLFTLPQAVFNMPVDKVLTISEDPALTKTFKINLVEYAIYNEDGSVYPGEIEWNEDKTALGYRMHEIFYSNSTYKIAAKVSFDEKVNGEWQQYKGDDGKVYYETKEAVFKTSKVPKNIPESAVNYTYPIKKMVNFYKKEYNKAYVAFNMGVHTFFENTEGYKQMGRWMKANGEHLFSSLKYNKNTKTVEVDIPEGLVNEAIYRFDLVHVPTLEDNSVDRNVVESTKQTLNESDGNSAEITTRKAQGEISGSEIIDFYGLNFRCSKYDKFLDKWIINEMDVDFRASISPAIEYPCVIVKNEEIFDQYEIKGTSKSILLIKFEAVLSSSDWYSKTYGRMIYDTYPIHPKAIIDNRDVSVSNSIPPVKPIWIYQSGEDIKITDINIENSTFSFSENRYDIYYGLPIVWANDYLSIRNNLVNLLDKNIITETKSVSDIVKTYPWPQLGKGNYPIKVSYQLPGIHKVTSSKVINLKNNFENTQFNIFD